MTRQNAKNTTLTLSLLLLLSALTQCTDYPFLLDPSVLVSAAQNYASNSQIDALSNLTRQKYYLYSGTNDNTVSTVVVKAVQTVAVSLGAQASNFATEYSINAGHGVPTLNYGVQCSDSSSPYINNCNYDGAGAIFQQLYGPLKAARGQRNDSNWFQLNTIDYVPSGWLDITLSLGDTALVYVPTLCNGGKKKCSLHIVFHGCSQATEFLGDVFYKNTGYAEWAETNGFVLLFPQAQSNPLLSNPLGCFDWWGFTNADYATSSSPQMVTFKNMAKYLGAKVF
jgi:hypothetical protein